MQKVTSRITRLQLDGTKVSGNGLLALSSLCKESLKVINLNWCSLTSESLSALFTNCINLESVSLVGCQAFNDDNLLLLSSLTKLTSLNLSRCNSVTSLKALSKLTSLNSLRLHGTNIDDDTIQSLSSGIGMNLTLFWVNECTNVTDEGVKYLCVYCRNLVSLNLSRCKITDTGINHLINHSLVKVTIISVALLTLSVELRELVLVPMVSRVTNLNKLRQQYPLLQIR
jgi:hypothetical protein